MTDYARREYVTKAKFFKDSDELVDIQVYRAADDAPPLGRASSFMSIDWIDNEYDEPWEAEIGEVYGEPRPYKFHGALIGADYSHVCGTDDEFRNGVAHDPDRVVDYDEQGIPLCCGLPATPFMGLVLGLELEVNTPFVPGDTCAEATLFPFGEPFTFTEESAAPVSRWARFPVTNGTTYRFTFTQVAGSNTINVTKGLTCAGLTLLHIFSTFGGSQVVDLTATADEFFYIEWLSSPFPHESILEAEPLP